MNPISLVVDHYLDLTDRDPKEYPRHVRAAKNLLELCDGNIELACSKLDKVNEWVQGFGDNWTIETVFKKWLEI